MSEQRLHLLCGCSHADHQVIVQYMPDDDPGAADGIYFTVHLVRHHSWRHRLRTAIGHVFGRSPCAYGDWAEVILDSTTDARALIGLLQRFVAKQEAWAERALASREGA